MLKWLKVQLTEFTAWTGAALIIGALIAPRSFFLFAGLLLIAIDDEKAKAWCAKVAPGLADRVERWVKAVD